MRASTAMWLTGWLAAISALSAAACSNPFGPQYEYEEQLYLSVGGQATVVIDTSLAALAALHGVHLESADTASLDRTAVRRQVEAAGCTVDSVSREWRRQGRRFVQITVSAANVTSLSSCGLLSWSSYDFSETEDGQLQYQQTVGAGAAGEPGRVTWDGSELVAFKLHLPSRITFHNVKRLADGQDGSIERGNILTWEQRLSDRRAGQPVSIDVRMEKTSILYTTVWLFVGAFAAAVGVLALVIWLTIRRGRRAALPGA